MKGKTILLKAEKDCFLDEEFDDRNSKGKRSKSVKTRLKHASRVVRKERKTIEIPENDEE